MFYLKSNLTGEASKLIQHLPVSNNNYEAAWGILCDRYNNKRLVVSALLNKLLSQPICQSESSSGIKTLHDTTKECVIGLENLGIPIDTWDAILVHILLRKLDKTTHALYEQSLDNPRELSSLKEVLDFLERRFQSLEAIGRKSNSSTQSKPTSFIATASDNKRCVVCNQHHPLYACKMFLSCSLKDRYNILKRNNICTNCLKPGHIAKKCNSKSCSKCAKNHNTLLHSEEVPRPHINLKPSMTESSISSNQGHTTKNQPNESAVTLAAHETTSCTKQVLLSTIKVQIVGQDGQGINCRAILDSGSQINFITERLAKRLSLRQIRSSLDIQGIGQEKQRSYHRATILVKSIITGFSTHMEVFILPQITKRHPIIPVDISACRLPANIQLADPDFHQPDHVDLLIGAEYFYQLLSIGQIQLGDGLPTLQNTVFGWVISGKVEGVTKDNDVMCGICTQDDTQLNEIIEKFWKLEEPDRVTVNLSKAEQKCETLFNQSTHRNAVGRFIVKLPFKQNPDILGNSKDVALARLRSMERKFKKSPEIRKQYIEFMNEYENLGHMERINQLPDSYYMLPHHCVLKPDSLTTKLRVVFDASAKSSTDVSLNDLLYTGPKIQDDLFAILLRFRLPRYVFTADIEKMYRQIQVDPSDRKYQLIAWRENEDHPVKYYQLNTVTYGFTSAPYLAIKCLQKLALQNQEKYPLAATCVKENFYVDDVMTGADSLREALDKQQQLNTLLQSAGFNLRKWCGNHPAFMKDIKWEDRAFQLEFHDNDDCHIKTLGLTWCPKSDEFHTTVIRAEDEIRVTKRKILSEIAHLFDPLGILGPVIVTAKLILQNLWELKLDWDAAVPMHLHSTWTNFRNELESLNNIKIPRHVFANKSVKSMQMHAFCDASEKAYGAAVYIRSIQGDGTIMVRLLCAKSKIAPLKKVGIPRLELSSAKLCAEIVHRIKTDLKWEEPCFYWTDSTIVLAWINASSTHYQTFVGNRISAIQEVTSPEQWHYVPTIHNPADVLSRGVSPRKLQGHSIWFHGPLFLHGSEKSWPVKPNNLTTDVEKKLPKISLAAVRSSEFNFNDIRHGNLFSRLQRIIAYSHRFINSKIFKNHQIGPLTVDEMEQALRSIIRIVQRQSFSDDYARLQNKIRLGSESPLISLAPILDSNQIIRVGGRLENANISYDAKHPMLLPYGHEITKMLITHFHFMNAHAGPQTLLATVRQRFWPIKGKTIVRSVVQNCIRCCRMRPKVLSQLMGNLPADRVQPARPFVNSGVDFCGPFRVHYKIRGKQPSKAYVAIFCCFATKAVHIELVSDLTTEGFIGALKRFVGRRGHCNKLYCDNATNFVGANNQLAELQKAIYDETSHKKITNYCTSRNIEFHFIPPRAPHFGGLWEAAVKSAKHLFEKSINSVSLTYEELETVMIEIEAILNSRPLTPMSSDPNDLRALTAGHFLVGEPLTSSVDPHARPNKGSLLYRWKIVSALRNEFWQRWTKEYLSELQHRYKWRQSHDNLQPGTMVILQEDNLPVLSWPLGRVIETFKGDDGLVRVANVKTSSGILKRAINRLAPLPIYQDDMNISPETDNTRTIKRPVTTDDWIHQVTGTNQSNEPTTKSNNK